MRHSLFAIYMLALIVLLAGCGDNPATPDDEQSNRLYFSPNTLELSLGGQSEITLVMSDLTTPVFGVSLRMLFNSSVINFSDTTKITVGEFFGSDAIAFFTQTGARCRWRFLGFKGRIALVDRG